MEDLKNYDRIHWEFKPKKGATSLLVNNLTQCYCGDIPSDVLEMGKMLILDSVGCMLTGALAPSSRKLKAFTDSQGGIAESTVAYFGKRTNRYNAALLNGAFCHAWGADSVTKRYMHCGAVVVPAALAVAEKDIREGNRILAAVILGWETMCRIYAAAICVPERRPLDPTSTFGPFGAAVAAGKILGFGEFDLENALSLCPSQSAAASRAMNGDGEVGALHGGFAASYGIRCAYLAKEGLSGPREILEGNMGFFQCVSGLHDDDKTPRYDVDAVNKGFGDEWLLRDTAFRRCPTVDRQKRASEGRRAPDGDEALKRSAGDGGGLDRASWDVVAEKFRSQAEFVGIGASRLERVIDMVMRLESLDDAGEILKQLKVGR